MSVRSEIHFATTSAAKPTLQTQQLILENIFNINYKLITENKTAILNKYFT